MTIAEMHVNFRQYAQQMGMQNVRAILPEQIDLLLNQSITDTVNQLIRENIGVTNDRVITDNSKIGQINAFRTLYDVIEVPFHINDTYYKVLYRHERIYPGQGSTITDNIQIENIAPDRPGTYEADDEGAQEAGYSEGYKHEASDGKSIDYIYFKEIIPYFTYNTKDRLQGLIKHINPGVKEDPVFGNYMFLIDLSINYEAESNETITTAWYPIRIIDSAYLSDTLNDFILKNRFRSPVACIYKDDSIELYIDTFARGGEPTINSSGVLLTPKSLRIDCVRYPDKVRYSEDIGGASVDCNLPESMHGDIVKHAVDLYRIALNGSLQASQQAEQNQQRENVRNNYRNDNNTQQ